MGLSSTKSRTITQAHIITAQMHIYNDYVGLLNFFLITINVILELTIA
jgi:hypothetical protein